MMLPVKISNRKYQIKNKLEAPNTKLQMFRILVPCILGFIGNLDFEI